MKKKVGFFIFLSILIVLNLISSLNLRVSSAPVQDNYIVELNESAIFDITIKNNGPGSNFKIYSAVGIDISPSEEFHINENEEKTIRVNLIPQESLRQNKGPLAFYYIIQSSNGEIKNDKMNMNIIGLADIISINAKDLTPESKKMELTMKNTLSRSVDNIFIKMDGAFFQYQTNLSFSAGEEKNIEVPLNVEKLKSIDAGRYIIVTQVKLNDKIGQKEVLVRFLEQENIFESESKSGIFIRKLEILKQNTGNVKKVVTADYKTNIIYSLFTSINVPATKKEVSLISKEYFWEKELGPGQELRIIIKTNWFYPILAVILVVVLVFFIKRYVETDLIVKKKVYYVKTMGGEFALRVHLKLKAKRYVSRIKVVDKIPSLVTLYDKFGAIVPDKIDLVNKKLEWDVEALHPGEEKVFSYIIYSKIGVVGKFELPPTKAMYERDGLLKTSHSNKSFFINKPKHHGI